MPRITVCLPGRPQQSFDCAAGENLYRTLAARRLMDAPCGGMGKCGKCRVRLPDSPPPAQPEDRRFFTADELNAGWRLACLHTVEGDMTVELPAREAVSDIVSSGLTRPAEGLPVVRKERTAQGGTRLLRSESQALEEPGDTAERLFGIAVGYIGTLIVGKASFNLILFPSPGITAGAFLISVALGIGFGLYPAIKASGLQPVVALRAE